jgi:predicted esterase
MNDPHGQTPVLQHGPDAREADAVLIMIHGRGAPAATMGSLVDALLEGQPGDVCTWLPSASSHVWYPQRFIVPREFNQPYLDSAIAKVDALIDRALDAGVPAERIVVGGFSQGACLALDVTARRGLALGGVLAYAGGLIGETLDESLYADRLDGLKVFLGSSDPDPHIPTGRVEASASLLQDKGAEVDVRLYPDLGHTLNEDELQAGRAMLKEVLGA